jgi:branched-chain amino acid transport system substrate-binding protein
MRKFSLLVAAFSALVLAGGVAAQQPPKDPKTYKIGAILAERPGELLRHGDEPGDRGRRGDQRQGRGQRDSLEAVIEDHKSGNAQEAVSAMNRLITISDVKIVLTSFSAPTQAIAPLADQHNVLLVNGGGVSNSLVGVSKYIFHIRSLAISEK